jgi:signal transduction histidine kinase
MDLNRATTFVRVVEAGGFTRAAEQVGLPPSSVSRAVAKLEDELGVTLLERTTRKIALTEAGRAYFERAREALAGLEEANSLALDAAREVHGVVRVALPLELGATSARLLAGFLDAHPRLRIEVTFTNRGAELVGDLVDLARDGEADVPHDFLPLDDVVHAAVGRVRLRAPWMQFEDTDVEPTTVMGDRGALERAIVNLLDNAVKFSPAGGVIRLGAKRRERAIELWVADQGPGVPAEERGRVFERFYRSPGTEAAPGFGLGLSLVQAIAEQHGAAVVLEDAGPGLRARIRFPL